MSDVGKIGVLFSGGGARGAYQAGCIRAIAETLSSDSVPFNIITGVSAGAINAAHVAAQLGSFRDSATLLNRFWSNLSFSSVISTKPSTVSRIAIDWITDLSLGAIKSETKIKSLVSTKPLSALLADILPVNQIRQNVNSGNLEAFAVTATDYETCQNITFVQSRTKDRHWKRSARLSEFADVSMEHILASAAIPILFPPVKIGDTFFGDGMLRNTAPLSAAIHLGATKLLTIGVRTPRPDQARHGIRPTSARILSVMMNSAMLDSVDMDIERMTLINELLAGGCCAGKAKGLVPIDHLYLRPSQDISAIAARHESLLPGSLRYMLRGLGTAEESAELLSYLLFASPYCQELCELGYHDTMARCDDVARFFSNRPSA